MKQLIHGILGFIFIVCGLGVILGGNEIDDWLALGIGIGVCIVGMILLITFAIKYGGIDPRM